MMTTMPTSFTDAVNDMKSQAITQAVSVLAEKYSFSLEDALRELKVSKVEAKAEKAVKKEKKETKKVEKTKRALNGYQVYMKQMRSDVSKEMEKNLEDGKKLSPKDVMTELGARCCWKTLTDAQRDEWKAKATELKDKESSASEGADSD